MTEVATGLVVPGAQAEMPRDFTQSVGGLVPPSHPKTVILSRETATPWGVPAFQDLRHGRCSQQMRCFGH